MEFGVEKNVGSVSPGGKIMPRQAEKRFSLEGAHSEGKRDKRYKTF